ncbi:MAG: hypothetical protein NVSMB65_18830 [Chloroflexota bacterium]
MTSRQTQRWDVGIPMKEERQMRCYYCGTRSAITMCATCAAQVYQVYGRQTFWSRLKRLLHL